MLTFKCLKQYLQVIQPLSPFFIGGILCNIRFHFLQIDAMQYFFYAHGHQVKQLKATYQLTIFPLTNLHWGLLHTKILLLNQAQATNLFFAYYFPAV